MTIFQRIQNPIAEFTLSLMWFKKVNIEYVSVSKMASLVNQYFISGASADQIEKLRKVVKGSIFLSKRIRTADKKYTFRITKSSYIFFTFCHIHLYDDTVHKKRTFYYCPTTAGKEFKNIVNAYITPALNTLYGVPTAQPVQPAVTVQYVNNTVPAAEKIKCPSCGTEVNKGTKFCPNCGSATEKHCPKCNAVVNGTSKFCPSCGEQL